MRSLAGDWSGRIALATLAIVAVWVLAALGDWNSLVNGVRLGTPFARYYDQQTMLTAAGVSLAPVLVTLFTHFACAVVGYRYVIRPIWGDRLMSRPWLMLAGLVPGVLLFVPVSRIVTLVLPNGVAPWAILALLAIAAAWAAADIWRKRAPLGRFPWAATLGVAAALAAALVFQVQFDRWHVTGESSLWFVNWIFLRPEHGIGTDGYFPLISQHYDEAMLLYPAIYGFVSPGPDASANITLLYWLMTAFGRAGMIVLIYLAMRGLNLDRLSSLISVAFICGASLALNPASSRLLFDSLSPLAYALHTARLLAPALPLLILSAIANIRGPVGIPVYAVAALTGLGAAAMPIHVALIFPWALALVFFGALNPEASTSSKVWRTACFGGLAIMLALSVVYGLQAGPALARVGLLVAAGGVPALLLAWTALRTRAAGPFAQCDRQLLLVVLASCVGYGLGVALLGNYAMSRVAPIIDGVWPFNHLAVLERIQSYIIVPQLEITQSPHCDAGYPWAWRTLTGHCGSLPDFARTYGLAFVAIAGLLAWGLLRLRSGKLTAGRDLTFALWALMLCLFALPVAFVLYDFFSSGRAESEGLNNFSIWVRSRLIEPWFIGGILIAATVFLRDAGRTARIWTQSLMLIAIALFAFNPLIFAGQWVANIAYLLGMAGLR